MNTSVRELFIYVCLSEKNKKIGNPEVSCVIGITSNFRKKQRRGGATRWRRRLDGGDGDGDGDDGGAGGGGGGGGGDCFTLMPVFYPWHSANSGRRMVSSPDCSGMCVMHYVVSVYLLPELGNPANYVVCYDNSRPANRIKRDLVC